MVRILLGLLLLTAAALKAHQLATEPAMGTGLLNSRWFLIGVVEFELFFAVWLWAGLAPWWSWRAAVFCFGVFAAVSLYKGLAREASCGCFGKVPVNPWYTFGLDSGVLLALLYWRPASENLGAARGRVPKPSRRSAWLAVGTLALGVPAGFAIGSHDVARMSPSGETLGAGELVVLEPETWVGKRFPLLGYIDIGEVLAQGRWTLLLYHHDCPECQKALADVATWARGPAGKLGLSPLALIEIPPYEASGQGANRASALGVCGRLQDVKTWFVETPLVLSLDQGRVASVSLGITMD